MKKSILSFTTAIALFTSIQASAQVNKSGPHFGVKGGLNLSTLFTDDIEDKNTLVGYNAGVFAKIPINSFLAFQPELYFTTKGSEITYNNIFANGTAKFNLNYVEVPLLLVVNLTKNINIHGGPYAAYLISSKVTNKSNVSLFDYERDINADDINRLDAGLALGAAIDVGSFSFGGRLNYGLTTVGKEKSFLGNNYTFPNSKNGVLNLYVALSIN